MRCFVPFCKNTSENVSERGHRISFHSFPSEMHVRGAWLRALCKQGSLLPDSAVVCSQHFVNDDIYETEGGSRVIANGAIPSTVQVCMICLDTDSKLFLMNKHKLQEAYEKLTGHPLCELGNLKQTVCVECAQRLINFNRFRDKSLRARALMMDLVEKHELITREHINRINRRHKLKSNITLTTLGPDHCDLHILEYSAENNQTDSEETEQELQIDVKTEKSDDSVSIVDDTEVILYEDDFVMDPLKYEDSPFHCTLCSEEFAHEQAFMQHMCMHIQNGDCDGDDISQECKPDTAAGSSSSNSSLITENKPADPSLSTDADQTEAEVAALSMSVATNDENKVHATEEADTILKTEKVFEMSNSELENQSSESTCKINVNINSFKNCVVKLYDIFSNQKVVPHKTRKADMACDSQNIASKDSSYQATNQKEVLTTEYIVPVTSSTSLNDVINRDQCINSSQNSLCTEKNSFTCDICRKKFIRKSLLVNHIKIHTEVRKFTCEICQHKYKYQCSLTRHMRVTHMGIKPFSCSLCKYKSAENSHLVEHLRTHTGIKPFSCTLCDYKCATNSRLVKHMRTHSGIKPFSCTICDYKCAQSSSLMVHLRTHTGIKPFSCSLCKYKSARNGHLVEHMRTHSGIKPFSCTLCDYKSATSSHLVRHMRTHSGIKPFSCTLCDYKCIQSGSLVIHMRTHTGIKPFSCSLCKYKSATKGYLVEHMRTHTGIKPFSCSLCKYKSATKGRLVEHMRTHTGIKPFSCSLCKYKSATKGHLVEHMKTHTGIKPFSCTLCNYKCSRNRDLVRHMRTHSGERPYSCNLCNYKCTKNDYLAKHMRTHTGEKPSCS